MIKALTPEQEALFSEYRDRYLEIGLSTNRIDFDRAVEVFKKFIEFDVDDERKYSFKYVESPDGVPSGARVVSYGSNDVPWVAYYTYFNDQFGICSEIKQMQDMVNEIFLIYQQKNTFYIVDRPTEIHMMDGLLHNETGPSILFSDGFAIYSWRGTRIPKNWIEDKSSITAHDCLHHENIEQRRCASEILGWDKVIEMLNPKVIDEDIDPEIGTLLEVDLPDIGREKFLKVKCGTGRTFAIPVPPEMKTALEAQGWGYGLTLEEFEIPEIRT